MHAAIARFREVGCYHGGMAVHSIDFTHAFRWYWRLHTSNLDILVLENGFVSSLLPTSRLTIAPTCIQSRCLAVGAWLRFVSLAYLSTRPCTKCIQSRCLAIGYYLHLKG